MDPVPEPPPSLESDSDEHVQKVVVVANSRAALERKHRARRNVLMIVAAVALAGAGIWAVERYSPHPLAKVASFETQVVTAVQQSFASFPTSSVTSGRAAATKLGASQSALTVQGIIADTNAARAANGGLPALAENATLDDIASLRLDNLFADQYFAHVNPVTGESALTVASSVGYAHIALGENLAEGFFGGDQGVVDAWMASPGHRANILDTHYTEIGVAAREGTFDGQRTWIAVQVFGKPTSACPPAPDPILEKAINAAETALGDMAAELSQQKEQIDAMNPQSGSDFDNAVSQYNSLVAQYNSLAAQTKAEVVQYNAQVDAYNACL